MVAPTREIAPGIHWIAEPGPDRSHFIEDQYDRHPAWYDPADSLHVPQHAYLLDDEESLLFDTLSPACKPDIVETLTERLDDGLDYLVVSHPDVPHAGNAMAILEAFPDATLVAPAYGNAHALYHLDDAVHVAAGDTINLGALEVEFVEASFPDAPIHIWMRELTTETLFPVDWLGYPHRGVETMAFPAEFDTELTVDRLVQFHGRVLFWFQYVDVDAVTAEIDRLIQDFEPVIVAPGHGNPIREGATDVMARAKEVVAAVQRDGRVGTLG